MKMILFIDDELRRVETYVDEFKEDGNYEVVFHSDVDEAFDFFQANQERIDLLILDVMMPAGKNFKDKDDENELGLRTGIVFHDTIRKNNPRLPIIILTNVSDQELDDRINSENSFFFEKQNNLPDELVERVKNILEHDIL